MATYRTASQTIAELREFAGFSAQEQFFIERSLEVGRAPCRSANGAVPKKAKHPSFTSTQGAGYREARALRSELRDDQPLAALDGFFAVLVRITAQDLSRGALESFAAYRFLYERLLGAGVRPYLPASFCAAAALPHIDPVRRKLLLESISEAVVTTPGWSEREPVFIPFRVLDEPDLDQ